MKLKTFEDITELQPRPTDQAIVNNVKDLLIELEDDGFTVEIGSCVIFGDGSVYDKEAFGLEKKGLVVESTNNQTTMSVFNTDTICIPCKDKEKEDPDYQLAVDTEAAEVRKGNYNYPGIYPNYKPLD